MMNHLRLDRRRFLALSGAAGLMPRLSFSATPGSTGVGDILVCLFLRGGLDGLHTVVPFGDPFYYDQRRQLALPPPGEAREAGEAGGVLDLDGFFGFHPALQPLLPLYEAGELALVHAAGSPDDTRSHFQAQHLMEQGDFSHNGGLSGWLGRHLALTGTPGVPTFRAVGMGGATQRSLAGFPAVAVAGVEDFGLRGPAPLGRVLEALYGDADPLHEAARQALAADGEFKAADPGQNPPGNGYPDSPLGQTLAQVGQLIRAENLGVDVVGVDTGGWDTHNDQEAELVPLLGDLAASLAAFHADMGERMAHISVVVMTEFGRRVAENASLGTDHGYGGLMLALGGNVNGGRIYADWPGLAPGRLYRDGDLAVSTDYRTVLGELVQRRLGNSDLAGVFPDYAMPGFLGIFR